MEGFGRILIVFGLVLVGLGVVLWLGGKAGLPIGRLPGDIHVERDGWSFHFPLVTCIVLSVVLTVVFNLVVRLLR